VKIVTNIIGRKIVIIILLLLTCIGIVSLFFIRANSNRLTKISLQKPSYYVFSVDWHPDGRRLAAASDTGTIDIWDVEDQVVRNTVQAHAQSAQSLAWKPDGEQIATVGFDWTASIWDDSLASSVLSVNTQEYASNEIWWSQDGNKLITSSSSLPGQIEIWDIPTQKLLSAFSAGMGSVGVDQMATQIAVSDLKGGIEIRNIQKPGEISTFLPGDNPDTNLNLIIWSPSDDWIASTSIDGSIFIWDSSDQRKVGTFLGHTESISGLAWSADSTKLATTSDDGTIRIWDVQNKKPLSVFTLPNEQYAVGWHNGRSGVIWNSGNDKLAVVVGEKDNQDHISTSNKVYILSTNTSTVVTAILEHESDITGMDWSPNGNQLAVSGGFGIAVWNIVNN